MENLIIRRTEPKDAQGLQQLYAGIDAFSQTLQLPNPSVKNWESRLNNLPENVHLFVGILDDEIVGDISLIVNNRPRQRHIANLGMAVKAGHHGKGIGTAMLNNAIDLAENWINISRIELTVYTDNEKAINLYKKFGFVVEGEAKNYAFRNGEFVNAFYMARVK